MSNLQEQLRWRAVNAAVRFAKIPEPAASDEVRAAIAKVRSRTMVATEGLITLWQQVQHCERVGLRGAFVECGVWHGGSVGLVAMANLASGKPPRTLHLFDSFEGIPAPVAGVDGDRAVSDVKGNAKSDLGGELTAAWDYADRGGPGSQEQVMNMFSELRYPWRTHVEIHKGWFQDTVPREAAGIGPVALLRLDGDWYESTKVCIDNLYEQVVPGGFVVIDDYGAYDGCRRAVDEFLDTVPTRPFLNRVNNEIYYLIKP